MNPPESPIAEARALIAASQRPVIFTGAGVSKESGVPTFRDAQEGLWARYNPEELASPHAFERQPDLVWNFYQHRRDNLQNCRPNAAHHALAALERQKPTCIVITQNVDGFHQEAGSRNVIPLHGNIREDRCYFDCEGLYPADAPRTDDSIPPRCPKCGEKSLRPNVIWFGEYLDDSLMEAAREAIDACDLLMIIGTSGVVEPAASLARSAIRQGKSVIEINPEPTPFSDFATVFLPTGAASILPDLIGPGSE